MDIELFESAAKVFNPKQKKVHRHCINLSCPVKTNSFKLLSQEAKEATLKKEKKKI